jgi:hypothetical protein
MEINTSNQSIEQQLFLNYFHGESNQRWTFEDFLISIVDTSILVLKFLVIPMIIQGIEISATLYHQSIINMLTTQIYNKKCQ